MIKNFLQELRTQRWDDHRYYHHSRINQSLHFVSAISFMFAYVMLFIDPVVSALVGWLVSMTSRQAGHFFFEPKGYDHLNQATHVHGFLSGREVVIDAQYLRAFARESQSGGAAIADAFARALTCADYDGDAIFQAHADPPSQLRPR